MKKVVWGVTIATNMAGRGTDTKSAEVKPPDLIVGAVNVTIRVVLTDS
jgi:hypothetical protein